MIWRYMFCAQMTLACWYEKESMDSCLENDLQLCKRGKGNVWCFDYQQPGIVAKDQNVVGPNKEEDLQQQGSKIYNHTVAMSQGDRGYQ